MHVATGLLVGARQVLSPHSDERPAGTVADLIVLHGISLPPGEFGGPWIEQLFNGHLPADRHPYFREIEGRRVSAHVLIRRDGEIVQFVPFHRRAWHAGASQYEERAACNDFSIGVEMEGTDDVPYEGAQYESASVLIRALRAAYPVITSPRLVGHSDISPGRKTDPGPSFDWKALRSLLEESAQARD